MGALSLGVHCEATLLPIRTPAYLFLGQQRGNGSRGPGVEAPHSAGEGAPGNSIWERLQGTKGRYPQLGLEGPEGLLRLTPSLLDFFSFIHSCTH